MDEQWNEIVTLFSGANTQAMRLVGVGPLLFLMAVALVSSLVIAALYLHFYAHKATGSGVYRAFPLLGISVAALFIAIQFSLPLSLGLLGALSIVRFRTPIKEPEEIGFIMVVIAAAVACATFKLVFLAVLLLAAMAGLMLQSTVLRFIGRDRTRGVIIITLPAEEFHRRTPAISRIVGKHLRNGSIESLSTRDGQVAVSLNVEGLTSVELEALQLDFREQTAGPTFNVLFNRVRTS